MPKQEYPMALYDANGKSQIVKTVEAHEALLGEGWAEDPDTAAGRPKPDADRPADAPWLGDIPAAVQNAKPKVEYPMWLYHVAKPAVVVQNATQHAALGEGWFESQAEANAPADVVRLAVPGEASNSTPEAPSTPPAVVPASVPLEISKMSAQEAVLYVDTIDSLDELARAAGAEEGDKNRVSVKRAIEARLQVLAEQPVVPVVPPVTE